VVFVSNGDDFVVLCFKCESSSAIKEKISAVVLVEMMREKGA
jgi:hypothetical protein